MVFHPVPKFVDRCGTLLVTTALHLTTSSTRMSPSSTMRLALFKRAAGSVCVFCDPMPKFVVFRFRVSVSSGCGVFVRASFPHLRRTQNVAVSSQHASGRTTSTPWIQLKVWYLAYREHIGSHRFRCMMDSPHAVALGAHTEFDDLRRTPDSSTATLFRDSAVRALRKYAEFAPHWMRATHP